MSPLVPSPDWQVLLQPFQSLFSKPGYRYFRTFVLTFAHLNRRLWVTRAVLSRMLNRHFTNFYRFLQSKAWSPKEAKERQVRSGKTAGLRQEAQNGDLGTNDGFLAHRDAALVRA